jgi:hypothetical protein
MCVSYDFVQMMTIPKAKYDVFVNLVPLPHRPLTGGML